MRSMNLWITGSVFRNVVFLLWNPFVIKFFLIIYPCMYLWVNSSSLNASAYNQDSEDSAITFTIAARLLADEAISCPLVDIQTYGGMVVLSGSMDNPFDYRKAVAIAETTRGVRSVINNISVTQDKGIGNIKNRIAIREQNPDSEILPHYDGYLGMDNYFSDRSTDNMIKEKATIPYDFSHGLATGAFTIKPVVFDDHKEIRNKSHNDGFAKISDEEIKKAVWDILLHDSRVLPIYIKVEVKEGMVTLTGAVGNLEEKNIAGEDAKNTAGVAMVKNNLTVRPVILPTHSVITDGVRNALSGNSLTSRLSINIEVQNDRVYLYGTVNTVLEKQRAGDVASQVPGVASVINKLKVRYQRSPKTDKEIEEKVKTELDCSIFVYSPNISVEVKNGVVYLNGTVHNHLESVAAVDNAFGAGAKTVRNFLKVTGEEDEWLKKLRIPDTLFTEVDYSRYRAFEDFYFRPYYFYLLP